VPPGVVRRLPAAEIEATVVDQLRGLLRTPEIIVGTWRSARSEIEELSEAEVREALLSLDPMWDELFPAEQARIIELLIERVEVYEHALDLHLRVDGLQTLVADLRAGKTERRAA
jgi:site-specific DNA recombinase